MRHLVLVLCVCVGLCKPDPFILEEWLDNCIYKLSEKKNLTFTSKLWKAENDDVEIYYTFCGAQAVNCGENVTACLRNKHDKSIQMMTGRKFNLEYNQYDQYHLILETGRFCKNNANRKYKLVVKFYCSDEIKEVQLQMKNDCEYEIYMMSPDCLPKCTTKINGQLFDLRPLQGTYLVHSKERNFSIALCDSNLICQKNDISSCDMSHGTIVPISNINNEKMSYIQEKNEIMIRGSYKGKANEGKKIFELSIKCSWDKEKSNISYKEVPIQGKRYTFEMESIHGCIKLPQNCVINDSFLIYNLTKLHNDAGFIQVSNVSNGNIYINICGPLHLKPNVPENACSRSYSQVCEVKDGNYINRGSILTKFELLDDVIEAEFNSGEKCKDIPSRQYKTRVDILCSRTEEGPKFVKSEMCDIFIIWKTPQACPAYDKTSCSYIHKNYPRCSINFQGNNYNLTSLMLKNGKYKVRDPMNHSIEYLLNVCGSVSDLDVPCMKNSMIIMKNLSEPNVKYSAQSLGQMGQISVEDGNLVINTLTGSFCGEGDFRSTIQFICSDQEGKPELVKKINCTFLFQWKTRLACLKKSDCLFHDSSNNMSLNFTSMIETSLKLNLEGHKTYIFDICKDTYTECIKERCNYFPLEKEFATVNNNTYIEMNLPKKCEVNLNINKVLIELVCDKIPNNEHLTLGDVNNCKVEIKLHTNSVCHAQGLQLDESKDMERVVYITENEQILKNESENCTVTNHNTGYKFYINTLQLNIPNSSCPVVSFNYNTATVDLSYSNEICMDSNEPGYQIVLKCSKQDFHEIEKTDCSEHYKFEKPEFCKLFETLVLADSVQPKPSNLAIILSSVTGGLFATGLLVFLVIKIWKQRKSSYETIYLKDGDL